MTSQPETELETGANPDSAEQTGDAALDFLIQRENEREQAQDAPEQATEADEPEQDVPDEAQDTPPDDPDIDIEVDGKPIKLKKSELPQIYKNQLMEADYRQKTAAAAEANRQAQAELQRIAEERQHGVNRLDAVLGLMHQELVGEKGRLAELLDTDPVAYLKVRNEIERKEALFHQAIEQRQILTQQQEMDAYRAQEEQVKQEQQKLQEKLPEWRDVKVREQESRAIAETLIANGYSHDELNMLTDHRALLLVRKAMKYDQMMAVRQKQAPPTPQKAVTPGVRNPNPPAVNKVAELKRAAKRTHSTDDILAYMLSKD